jgi:hypothetical protein
LNQKSSPDRLAFQIARTTISPNYPGEELETLDRQNLVISVDVPPQDGETDEQRQERENANAAIVVRRQQEIAAAAPGAGQQLGQQPLNVKQVNANARNKHLRHHLPLNSGATMTHLVPTDYMHETSSGTSSATDLKFTTRRKPTWEPLLPL